MLKLKTCSPIVVFLWSFAILPIAFPQNTTAITGPWLFHYVRSGEEVDPERLSLSQSGEEVTGSLNDLHLKGSIRGREIEFVATQPDGTIFGSFHGSLAADVIRGEFQRGAEKTDATLRKLARLDLAPETRTFIPTGYSRVFDGKMMPVMHLRSGDTVKTTTIDAAGYDMRGVTRSNGGNPETGPFFIDGAAPGDTLAVTIKSLHLNRDSALSDGMLAPASVHPFYFGEAKTGEDIGEHWRIDAESGVSRLENPSGKLRNFAVPLHPMLGCIAVAPPDGQAYRANWLGSWGGNMDYNRLQEGTTVYLPIFQEGAFLFIGDGHAQQGDGEINGNALETSMDVEITVRVIPSRQSAGPRAEDGEFIMAMGISGSLTESVQAATSGLARWLQEDYKLNANEAAIVLGTSIRYDIAEIVDPQVNVVARISKKTLEQIGK